MSRLEAPALILTPRLRLVAPDETLAEELLDFRLRNEAHLRRWDPPLPADWREPEHHRERMRVGAADFAAGTALRWWMLPASGVPVRIIGTVNLSAIVRGAFHSAHLGYAIDHQAEGRGLMSEALRAVIACAFGPAINLHRLQAAVRPENTRSLILLGRLGFREEGLARDYLFIDGAWRDHRLLSRTHPGFIPPAHWMAA